MSQTPGPRIGPSLPSYNSFHDRDGYAYDPLSGLSATDTRKSLADPLAHADNGHLSVKGWPNEPRKLRDRTILTSFFNLCEALITLAPIAFISKLISSFKSCCLSSSVFAILAARLDGKPVDGNGLGHNIRIITRLVSYDLSTLNLLTSIPRLSAVGKLWYGLCQSCVHRPILQIVELPTLCPCFTVY
jgi:hypothetical protein